MTVPSAENVAPCNGHLKLPPEYPLRVPPSCVQTALIATTSLDDVRVTETGVPLTLSRTEPPTFCRSGYFVYSSETLPLESTLTACPESPPLFVSLPQLADSAALPVTTKTLNLAPLPTACRRLKQLLHDILVFTVLSLSSE